MVLGIPPVGITPNKSFLKCDNVTFREMVLKNQMENYMSGHYDTTIYFGKVNKL
jgi:hypothetical protein